MIGHDFGSPVATYCAVIQPDVFRSVVLMSAPFAGPPQLPFNSAEELTPSVPSGPSKFKLPPSLRVSWRKCRHGPQLGMAETAAEHTPSQEEVAACRWLTDAQLSVYADEFARTGFQGGLQWYRCLIGKYVTELETFSHRTIDVPACFISGKSDWGVYQLPGALEMMETTACTQWRGTHLVDGAGHWVQQEQPEEVSRLLLQFIDA